MERLVRIDRSTGKQVGKPSTVRSRAELARTDEQVMQDDRNLRAQNRNQKLIRDHFDQVGWNNYYVARVPVGKR